MMTHVDEGVLQALTDGELDPGERERVERHLAGCVPCRAELSALRETAGSLTQALALLDRAPAEGRHFGVGWPARPAVRSGWRSLPRAAVLVLGFAAAASATLPGSPLRRWLAPPERAAPAAPTASVTREAPAATPATSTDTPVEAGVSVAPQDGVVSISLRGATPELRLRAVLTDRGLAGVYAAGDAASAHFQTGPGRIVVTGAARGELRIELPHGDTRATVTVDGAEYLRKEGARLHLAVGAESRTATEVIFRVRP